jgi:predicted thioesterase
MLPDLKPGLVGEVTVQVGPAELASAMGSGSVDVYGTPAMIGLMESAAINAVDHLLPEGWASVGTRLDVRHLAPSPPGVEIRARAELVAVDGRRLTFRVEASDPVEPIGEGTHERALVDVSRLVARADAKRP